jgi:hypothetical protein
VRGSLFLGGDVLVESKIGGESLNFRCAHSARMPFLMNEDKALDPVDVSFLRPDGIVVEPQALRGSGQAAGLWDWECPGRW